MNPFEFFIPQNITVGAGTLAKLPECAKKLGGSHAMLISGPTLRKMGVVDKAADYLKDAGMAVDIFTDVEANPSVTTVEKATEAYKDSGADFIVALGGGSPMDVAKAVGVTAKYGGSITEYEGAHKVPGKIVPLIAIPTTAGTGSEVTAFSVITDHSRDYKLTVFSYELLPAYAILDPELLTSAPASVAAACGIDAFIHAIESYVSPKATLYTQMFSMKAMEMIMEGFRKIAKHGEAFRMNLLDDFLTASNLAGIAFGNAGTGAVHAMSYPLSGVYHVTHGEANYQFLTAVFAKYQELDPDGRIKELNSFLSNVLECDADLVYVEIGKLLDQIIARKPLHEYGMREEEIESFAKTVEETQQRLLNQSYVKLTWQQMAEIYKELY